MSRKNSVMLTLLVAAALLWGTGSAADDHESEADRALERTRKQVRMLDDIYKGGVVLITEHYVDDEADLPAGTAFKLLFATAKEKGWHEVRLLDATDQPINDDNTPRDDFEQEAIEALTSGQTYYDRVITKDERQYLRAATPIPVVMQKCIMCHDHYADYESGRPIGALAYTVPIE